MNKFIFVYLGDHHKHWKSWVFGIVEEKTGLNVMWMVDDRKKPTLTNIIKDHVKPGRNFFFLEEKFLLFFSGTVIKSDQWRAYNSLNEEGYKHLTVNHSIEFVSSEGVHTQLIESLWSQVKMIFKIKRGTRKKMLPGYLDYYSFLCLTKFRKKSPFKLFLEIIQIKSFSPIFSYNFYDEKKLRITQLCQYFHSLEIQTM